MYFEYCVRFAPENKEKDIDLIRSKHKMDTLSHGVYFVQLLINSFHDGFYIVPSTLRIHYIKIWGLLFHSIFLV